jgi:O-succinylbenzoate synthase
MADAIERVTLTRLKVPLKEPCRTVRGEVAAKEAILVTVETRSGIGVGEASPPADLEATPGDTPDACWDDLAGRIAPALLGTAVADAEGIAATASGWSGASRYAVAGAETALWDILGQARHATIAELLGASVEQIDRGVDSGLVVGLCPTVVELLKTVETHLAEGYRRVKIRIAPGQDVEPVRAIRQHFGDVELMVDGEGSFGREHLDVFRALDGEDLLMIEQPLPADDLDGLAAL